MVLTILVVPALAFAQSDRRPLPPPEKHGDATEPAPAERSAEPVESAEPAPDAVDLPSNDRVVIRGDQQDAPGPPPKVRRLYRIGAFTFAMAAALPSVAGISLGMDFALFGQEFHNQARTFSLLNATIGTVAAAGMIWPLGLALDGNGDFWATSLSALAAGGVAIGVMYAWAHGDPDRLLAQSFTPGFAAFLTAIVAYEMTSDTSADYRETAGEGDAWIAVTPSQNGAAVGLVGTF